MAKIPQIATLLLTGTVGSGKTGTAVAIGHMLQNSDQRAVVIDLDWLGWTHLGPASPAPGQMIIKNLVAIWPNFRAAGMRYAILARGLTSRADLESLKLAIPDADITVVRLTASTETLDARLRLRDTGAELDEHLREAAGMAEVMERLRLEDFVVSTEGATVEAVAAEVIRRLGWNTTR